MIVHRHRANPAVLSTQARRGLSLIEVLMALAIFLMSLVALSQLIELGGDRARDMQMLSQASPIAQSNMDRVISGVLPLSGQSESPSDEDSDWNVAIDVSADNTPGLNLVTVTVSRDRPDGSRFELKLTQYVLDPTQRGNTAGSDAADAAIANGTATGGAAGTTTGGGS